LDYGTSNPTAVLAYAVDYDGNLIVFDGLYQPGARTRTRIAQVRADV
jgi:hypothetical protein